MDIIIKFTILIRIICDKKVYISICNFFLDNGYTYVVKNGFGDYCGDLIEKECAVKASEYMLDKNINEFLESSHEEVEDKRRIPGMVQKENIMERYNVNIFVDNSRTETVPLVMDVDYSFENIFRKSRV